jgi:hypothetical protein
LNSLRLCLQKIDTCIADITREKDDEIGAKLGVIYMMYPYLILGDDIEIMHSHLIEKDGVKEIMVHFERATEDGFDSARCALPYYKWTKNEGFSDSEIRLFEEFLKNNAHLLYRYAESGGVQIA